MINAKRKFVKQAKLPKAAYKSDLLQTLAPYISKRHGKDAKRKLYELKIEICKTK
jgi:hypothetical protein